MEGENLEYEQLVNLSGQKRQVIIDGNIPRLEDITSQEQEVASNLKHLENKRLQIINDMAIVLSKKPEDLTLTNMIAFLNNQPREQARLKKVQKTLSATIEQMKNINRQNQILLDQAMEMVEFDLTLFKSMRQAPTTANYNRQAYNTGDVLGSGGFDAKQ